MRSVRGRFGVSEAGGLGGLGWAALAHGAGLSPSSLLGCGGHCGDVVTGARAMLAERLAAHPEDSLARTAHAAEGFQDVADDGRA